MKEPSNRIFRVAICLLLLSTTIASYANPAVNEISKELNAARTDRSPGKICGLAGMFLRVNNITGKVSKDVLASYKPYFSSKFYNRITGNNSLSEFRLLPTKHPYLSCCVIPLQDKAHWIVNLKFLRYDKSSPTRGQLVKYRILIKSLKHSIPGNYADMILAGFYSKPLVIKNIKP